MRSRLSRSSLVVPLCTLLTFAAYPTRAQELSEPLACTLAGEVSEYAAAGGVEPPLVGANILLPALNRGAATNEYGHFRLGGLPCHRYRLRVTFVGYVPLDTTIALPASGSVRLLLRPEAGTLGEVTVTAQETRSTLSEGAPASTIDVTALPIEEIPVLLGEPDLIRIVQRLPGVKTESDFSGRFYVRGGRADQNLVLLDGAPVYSPWHLFGLFSAFNSEALERVELAKGVLPPQYGGRLSSLLDVELEDGSDREGAGHLNVSVLSSTVSYGRPISDRTSVLVAARRTYMDPLFWIADDALSTDDETFRTRYNFTDLNAKVAHRFGRDEDERTGGVRYRLVAGVFYGDDRFRSVVEFVPEEGGVQGGNGYEDDTDVRAGWRNATGTVQFESTGARWSLRHQVHASLYDADNRFLDESRDTNFLGPGSPPQAYRNVFDLRFRQRLSEVGYRTEGTLALSRPVEARAGAYVVRHAFEDAVENSDRQYVRNGDGPEELVEEIGAAADARASSALGVGVHGSLRVRVPTPVGTLTMLPGLRVEHYDAYGAAGDSWTSLLPRLSVTLGLVRGLTLSAGYGESAQYLHVVGNERLGLPTDRWLWADAEASPSRARLFTAGLAWELSPERRLQVETYYKQTQGLRAYSPLALYEAFQDSEFPVYGSSTIGDGEGEAYGVEVFFQQTAGRWTGWAGYTWSRSLQRFDALNYGRPYPAATDRPHDLQLAVTRALGTRWRAGAVFGLQSGQPTTLATSGYLPEGDPLGVGAEPLAEPLVVTRQNNYRLPTYHRLDVSLSRRSTVYGRPSELTLTVINVYNRRNPFLVVAEPDVDVRESSIVVRPHTRAISQLPILPMLSLRVDLSRPSIR